MTARPDLYNRERERPLEPHPMLQELLLRHFGHRAFLEGQEPVIQAVLRGEDALVIMPTGGGKSLCYQLPALMLDGITVVVSPLIALMKDQVDGLVARGVPAAVINSSLGADEVEARVDRMRRGEYRLVYVAPERFKSERFVRALAPLSIALFAVDEAHCISQWGHDFRPDYLRLKGALGELGRPPVAALTATATPDVRADIIRQLGLGGEGRRPPCVFVSGFARPNLTLSVSEVGGRDEKLDVLGELIAERGTGLVYCATRKNVESVAAHLARSGVACVAYHAGMTEEQRTRAQERFMGRACAVAVATNAFGMGIDRPDLRFVAHHDIPGSLEAYYQEAGRAGRDGEPARCELLYNYADVRTQEFFIEGANPTREVIAGVRSAIERLCRRGPIEMAVAEIAKHVPEAESSMAVGSALHVLERAGFLRRGYKPGSRTYTTEIVEPVRALEDLPVDFERLEAKREHDFAKLKRMIAYADHDRCRHRYLLEYFGDPEAGERCHGCDNCLARAERGARLPTADDVVAIQKALSCVARVDGRFGRGRIAQTLAGSRSKDVIDAGLDQLPTYGLLADLGADAVWSLLNALVDAGCLAVSPGQYPTLSLTTLGDDVMRGRQAIPMVLPSLDASRPARLPARGAQAGGAKPARAGGTSDRATGDGGDEGPYDTAVFEALRQWRREKAAEMGDVPAYLVYADRTLRDLARRLPRTEADLLAVRGIGPAKAARFGAQTLAVIRKASVG